MKLSLILLGGLSAACMPAMAQLPIGPSLSDASSAGFSRDTGARALLFFRVPLGEHKPVEGMRFGFGLFTGCSSVESSLTSAGNDACDSRPLRSVEFSSSFDQPDWTLSFSGAGRRADFATWSSSSGALSFAEDGGAANWLWLGLGGVAILGLVAASGEDGPTLCPDGFVSTPLSRCQPIS